MNVKIKIILGIYLMLSTIIIFSFDIKIRMLARCTGMGFYSYFDDETGKCSCYGGYVLKDRACIKK